VHFLSDDNSKELSCNVKSDIFLLRFSVEKIEIVSICVIIYYEINERRIVLKGKISNILLWFLSIFFLLSTFAMFSTTWASVFFVLPAILLNPYASKLLKDKAGFNNKNWIRACSVVISFIIYSMAVPPATTTDSVAATSSQNALSSDISSTISSQTSSELLESSSSAVPSSSSSKPDDASVTTKAEAPASGAKLTVHYIDVGQGDSEFLELPNGQTMLIDAGNPENGTQIVNYIKELGYNKIDYLIATHPHADHIGGMATVVNSLDIGSVYMPKVSTNTKTFEGLLTAIQNKGLKVNTAKSGVNLLKSGNLNIDIIAPCGTSYDDLNQYSAVLKVTYGANKFLFTGDAGAESEAQITADVSADVLKVGHHGSSTSTSQAFLNKVNPKYAVIEVGAGNSYGHPAAATISKLQNIGATIYRTDKDGTIIFTSDAKTITVNKKASTIQENAPPATDATSTVTEDNTSSTADSNDDEIIVYITDTGKKYHTSNCRFVNKSKYAITLKEAKEKGYTPCKVCDPPQ
jgi:competence protein ComEC